MTNREMFLLATSILFASTTVGIALQGALHHPRPPHGPGFERPFDGPGGPDKHSRWHDGKRPDFFAMGDADKDGFVTRDEMLARQNARLDEIFATVDTDKDGKLTRDEMDKGRKLMHEKMRARFEAERKAAEAAAQAAPVPAQ